MVALFVVAFFILCASVIVAQLAKGRGRSALGWGTITCLASGAVMVVAQAAAGRGAASREREGSSRR